MKTDGYFGEEMAKRYDADSAMFDPEVVDPAAEFLAELARGGRALEFGIGTGRIALPLAQRGVEVAGIDMSEAMVSQLRAKPNGADMEIKIGDFSTMSVEGSFSLVYLVFNTINNLTTQDAQVACFRNAAAHLAPNGCFVVEVGVPALQRLPMGKKLIPHEVSETHWCIDEYDVVTQAFSSHHLNVVDGKLQRNSIPFRYVWPAELDLMAQLSGLSLSQRWDGWAREPFTDLSERHVSVWTKTAD